MLPLTNAFLRDRPEVWDDSSFAFGCGANISRSTEMHAVLAFFGPRYSAPAMGGHGQHELLLNAEVLSEIDRASGQRALVQLLKNDLRMFSVRKVDSSTLEELAEVFFKEMGESRVYSNTVVKPPRHELNCLGPYSPVTKHSMDTFVCVVNPVCVAYWLYGDDE